MNILYISIDFIIGSGQ